MLGVGEDHVPLQPSLMLSDESHEDDGRGEEYAESCIKGASAALSTISAG